MPTVTTKTKDLWVPLEILNKFVRRAIKYEFNVEILDEDEDEEEIQVQIEYDASDKKRLHQLVELVDDHEDEKEEEEE